MKKLLSIGLLTVCAFVLAERQADAWLNSKFSIGMNWSLQSGNNSILWGLWKNGQVPGPEAFGDGGPFQYGPASSYSPGNYYYGQAQPFPAQTAAPPLAAQQYQYNPYQSVSYQNNAGYYYVPNYNQAAPSYWYQGR